jgi:hypothetical protein
MKLVLVAMLLVLPCQAMTQEEFSLFQAWLESDQTNLNVYADVTYDCLAFSSALVSNATAAGLEDVYMANVQAPQYPDGHWINAALVDGEYVFIEPQGDILVDLEGAHVTVLDSSMQDSRELKGKNNITVTGNLLIPQKA